MYVPPTLRFMVLEDLFCLQKLRLQQSLYGVAAAFFVCFFQSCPPPSTLEMETADCPPLFPPIFRKPVFESPPASGSKADFIALTGRYHPARH